MRTGETTESVRAIRDAVTESVIIDEDVLALILTGLLARGHVLLEDVPGTGKTLTARSVAAALGLSFSRIQFTPDLLPADVTGTNIFNEQHREFEFKEGPLFANIVLADEINRASPKTQAALLEAMEEQQVTVSGETHPLPRPFFVIATQNPLESGEGTFPLPEAQKDRFILKTSLGYPGPEEELELLDRRDERQSRAPAVTQVLSLDAVNDLQAAIETVESHTDVKQYIIELVGATRADPRVDVGISPRGTQRLFEVSRAWAAQTGRNFVTPDDVKAVAVPALSHRLVLTPDARVDKITKSQIIEELLENVPAPTITRVAQE